MKKVYFILLVLCVWNSKAQNVSYLGKPLETKGDYEYTKFAYQSALEYYKRALEINEGEPLLFQKIANCYRLLNDQTNAEGWYKQVIQAGSNDYNNYLYYAQALESNQKYDDAKIWYEKYQEQAPFEERIDKKLAGLEKVKRFFGDSGYYEITPVRVNSRTPDFSSTFYKNGIVFVSGRNKSPVVQKVFTWDNSSYLDLFYAEITEDEHLERPRQFNRRLNTRYHEGPLAFYQNETKVIFTRNNYYEGKEGRSSDDINKLKLYFAENNDGNWTNIEEFQYNDNEYSVGHPTISEDGDLLIFASDMIGSKGGTDLWMTKRKGNSWTAPENLGPKVNTEGNEMFPYMKNGILYFSSNGHEGLGGLDVYRASFDLKNEVGEAVNLGAPLNSSKDDFGYITNDDGASGYFSSNRTYELYDNLYHFSFDKPRITEIAGLVELKKDFSPIELANVYLIDSLTSDTLQLVKTDRKGRFQFEAEYDKNYIISAKKDHFSTVNIPVVNTYSHQKKEAIVLMERLELVAKVIAIDKVTKELIPKPHIIVLNPLHGNSLTPTRIDVDTFEYVIQPNITYVVGGAKRYYFTEHVDHFSGNEKYGEVFWIVPLGEIELDKAIELEKIYYDLNKANIRPDATVELNKLVTILQENPDIKIELSSHTDSRGSDAYNKALSQRRAESAVAYIIDQGISAARITARGYGEERLVNDCSNGVDCSKNEHQRNRRTEFKVTDY